MKGEDVKQGAMVPYRDGEDADETNSVETPTTKRERIRSDNIKLCGSITEFFLFLLTFSLAMLVNQSVATSRLSDHIRMKMNPTHYPITRITDVHTLYDYLEEVFIPAIYKNTTDIQLAESISPHLRPIDIANRLLGTVRLRQVRVDLQQNCQVLPLFEQYTVSCYPNYSPGTASKMAFGPLERFTYSEDMAGIDYAGSLGSYTSNGFMQLLASNATLAAQQIAQLRADGFLDAATRAFFAEFNIWNSNVGLYAVVNFVVEFGASGGTAQQIEITTMTERVLTVGGLGTGMDWFAFVLLILVMFFVVQFIFEEVQELYGSWRTYFFDAWNLLDWANMILLLVGFTMRMLLFSDAANANVGIEQLSNKESFQNISALASVATTVRVLNAFNCVLLWGKVTKYLRHLPLVKGLIRTVWNAFDLFVPFLIMFCVGMVGFVMAFNVGFGDKVAELSNFSTSVVYLCRAFLKDVQLMPVYDITPLFGAGLILLFYLNMIAVGLALMFAMMADALFIAKYSKEMETKVAEQAFWHEDEPMEEVYRTVSGFTQRMMIKFFPMLYVRYLRLTERPNDEADAASDGLQLRHIQPYLTQKELDNLSSPSTSYCSFYSFNDTHLCIKHLLAPPTAWRLARLDLLPGPEFPSGFDQDEDGTSLDMQQEEHQEPAAPKAAEGGGPDRPEVMR
ncbi:unnamed protein product [Effrenium voratum]|nr:unnamed protein product [Effrenium voratum]